MKQGKWFEIASWFVLITLAVLVYDHRLWIVMPVNALDTDKLGFQLQIDKTATAASRVIATALALTATPTPTKLSVPTNVSPTASQNAAQATIQAAVNATLTAIAPLSGKSTESVATTSITPQPIIMKSVVVQTPNQGFKVIEVNYSEITKAETWKTGSIYVMRNDLVIREQGTLIIEPGVIIKLIGRNRKIWVGGALQAKGTETNGIVFTSFNDDQMGGDTNQDSTTTLPAPGDWGQIWFNDSSRDKDSFIAFTEFRYAGAGPIVLDNASPTLINTPMFNNLVNGYTLNSATWQSNQWQNVGTPYYIYADIIIDAKAILTIGPGVTIKVSGGRSTHIWVNGILDAQGTGSNPIIFTSIADDTVNGDTNNDTDTTLPQPGDWDRITFNDNSRDDKVKLKNVQIHYANYPIFLDNAAPTLQEITLTNNFVNAYTLNATTWQSSQWRNVGTPYYIYADIAVDDKAILTIGPGVVIKMGGGRNTHIWVNGIFDAQGLADKPVIFTSIADDTIENDTNNDADATLPQPGDWDKIVFNDNSRDDKTKLVNVQIHYANYPIFLDNAAPTLQMVTLTNNQINAYTLNSTTWQSNQWQNSGTPYYIYGDIIIDAKAILTIKPGVVIKLSGGRSTHIWVNGTLDAQAEAANPIVFTSLSDDTIGGDTNNDTDATTPQPGDWDKIVFNDSSRDDKTRLVNVQIHYANYPIFLDNASPTLQTMTLTNNLINAYTLNSTTWQSNQWQNSGTPYYIYADIIIDEKAILRIGPGVVLKLSGGRNTHIWVKGVLNASGTTEHQIILTSIADDTIEGDTNNDIDATIPQTGDWDKISFEASSRDRSLLQNVLLRYADPNGYQIQQGAQPKIDKVKVEP